MLIVASDAERTVFGKAGFTAGGRAKEFPGLFVQTGVARIRAHRVVGPTAGKIRLITHAPGLAPIPEAIYAIGFAEGRNEEGSHLRFLHRDGVVATAFKREFEPLPLGDGWILSGTSLRGGVKRPEKKRAQQEPKGLAYPHACPSERNPWGVSNHGRFEHFAGGHVNLGGRLETNSNSRCSEVGPVNYEEMKTQFISPVARFLALGALSTGLVGTLPLLAKEPPKLSLSDHEVDRSTRATSYAPVIKKVTPSVVTIVSTHTIQMRQFRHPFLDDPMFRRFFGPGDDSSSGDNSSRGSRKLHQESLGSGVIMTEDGYILTNNHVVDGADEDGITVALADGVTKYDAKVVGKDPQTDVAVLKIEASDKLPAITLTDSDKLEVGDVVLAVGNPFGIGQSVSMGIISALGRGFGILGKQGYEDFIQTDASINQGNSGGALVDSEGRLIGINQSIASPSGANAGVGFAVPVNLARSVMEQLISDGKIVRGFLGVQLQMITPELAESFKLPDTSGALVGGVQPGTPAAMAGMEGGDVIVGFNGKKVTDSAHLRLMVSQTPPKTLVSFKVLRDGKEKDFKVTLAMLPDDLATASDNGSPETTPDLDSEALGGVEVADLDSQARREYEIPQRIRGALVAKVDPDSKAGEAGLRPGEVIMEINRRPVRNADDAVELTRRVRSGRVLLRVYSPSEGLGSMRYLSVEVTRKK
jgi:serine protease Do